MRLLSKIQIAQELAKLINRPILYLNGLCWNGNEFIVPGYMTIHANGEIGTENT